MRWMISVSRRYWLVSSFDYESLQTAQERLMWGFWDKNSASKQELRSKLKKNWRDFITQYNTMKPGDIVFFQNKTNYKIHGFGIIREKYYDDQTPIWSLESKYNRVLFPWRLSFQAVLMSKMGFSIHAVNKSMYLDGYGLGALSESEAYRILKFINIELGGSISVMF
ncbi:MAG: hypothetical protein J7K48_08485 [Thermococcus sp.]|nr:hypothetical protein [Thermococcus sp.]